MSGNDDTPISETLDVIESWLPVDLSAVLAGDLTSAEPTVLAIDTVPRRHLFYAGALNGVHGDSGIGKSWIATITLKEQIEAGRNVMLLDFEDTPQTLCSRLLAQSVAPELIARHVDYRRPLDQLNTGTVHDLIATVYEREIAVVVIDSLGELFGLHGKDENADKDVGPFLRGIIRPLADAGAAVIVIDHSTKSKDNPLHPSGSKRKRAAITGASYFVSTDRPPVRATGSEIETGRLKITCAKDRHGTYRSGEHVANIEITSYPDGGVRAHVWPVDKRETKALPVELAARAAIRVAREKPGHAFSMNELLERMAMKARKDTKRAGVEYAATEGCLSETAGPRGSRCFTFVRDLEVADVA